MMTNTMNSISIRNGNIYVDLALYEKFFAGSETVALLKHEPGFLVMPVFSHANGGRLLKKRNRQGDRVVVATDFLEQFGLNSPDDKKFEVFWNTEVHALMVNL
jgi:hypothetical protein